MIPSQVQDWKIQQSLKQEQASLLLILLWSILQMYSMSMMEQ